MCFDRFRRSAVLIALFLAAPLAAHQPWVLTDREEVATGQAVDVQVYFGHVFPGHELIDAERVAAVQTVDPGGRVRPLDTDSRMPFPTPPLDETGTWVIAVEQVRGYWTQTPEGGRPLPRTELREPVHCSYSGNSAKTVVRVGADERHAIDRPLGHRLEILPGDDPTNLEAGDRLTIEVRFDGQPHVGSVLLFHADSGEEPYSTVETDAGGRAVFGLEGAGPWMAVAHAERPYPDPEVCDVESFHATLTFGGSR